MSYSPTTDFLALLRQTSGGVRTERMPGLDYLIAAMARAGMFVLSVGQTAPTSNLVSTVWIKPASPSSWAFEASIFLYNVLTAQYEPATPALWFALLSADSGGANFAYLPGGVLQQWGTANVGTVFTAVNFPIAFSVAPNVTATVKGAATVKAVGVGVVTGVNFTAATTTAAENINWHAIGAV